MNYHDRKAKTRAKSKAQGAFSTAELARKTGDVLHAATQAPISITKNGKPRFVMMTTEAFQRINPQKAYRAEETPDEVAEWLVPALEKIAAGDFDYDEK
jgi:prevent-host-death family protein